MFSDPKRDLDPKIAKKKKKFSRLKKPYVFRSLLEPAWMFLKAGPS